ncbi:MAG TPA: hypothetical protein VNJ53_07790 [Gaiellaceae bacterium]|nr:hypothetical protein [Gaiellaceae bacterium]
MRRLKLLAGKQLDLEKLDREFRAASPSVVGLQLVGDELLVLGGDDLSDAQAQALVATHVPRSAAELAAERADAELKGSRLFQAALEVFLAELNAVRAALPTPQPPLDPATVTARVRDRLVARR